MLANRPCFIDVSFVLILLLGVGASPELCWADDASKVSVTYRTDATMMRNLALLKAFGLMPKGKSDGDFGRLKSISVGRNLSVANVPVDYFSHCAQAALTQAFALGLFPGLKDPTQFTKALKQKTLKPRDIARALVAWWTAPILAEIQKSNEKLSAESLLTRDAGRHNSLSKLRTLPSAPLAAHWLLFPAGLDSFSPNRVSRSPATFRLLLQTFDPARTVTRKDAAIVAEELAWTKSLGLSDGTAASLPDSRRIVQALLLERLGFQVGDPMASDKTKRAAARERMAAALRKCAQTWK